MGGEIKICYNISDQTIRRKGGRKKETNMEYRIEHDTLGEVRVPAERKWGAQTQRSLENFRIGHRMPMEIIYAFAVMKKCAALANAELSGLDEEKKNAICEACDEILVGKWDEEFPLVVYQTGSGTQSNMNLNEVIAHLANEKLAAAGSEKWVHPNDDVNKSQSSNDTFPAAMHIAAVKVLHDELYGPLDELIAVFGRKSEEYMRIVKIGRTHVQDAVPLTFGQEISGWAEMLKKSRAMIRDAEKYLLPLALGGTAVGTGLNAPKGFGRRAAELIAGETGLPFTEEDNKFYALTGRDNFVYIHGALDGLAGDCMKFADDIRLLASGPRSGLGEISIPANEPGSSIMPGKVNPTQCEALTMAACRVHGNQAVISMGSSQGRFELNVYAPVIADAFIESVKLLGEAIHSFTVHCAEGMEPIRERMQELVENSLMLVTALSPHIGYEKAAAISKHAFSAGCSLREAAEALGYVTAEEYDTYVQPEKMTNIDR